MHLLMLAEGGALILGGLLLEINAGVIALMMACAFAHEATAMFDVGYTVSRRLIPPGEQHTHSFLDAIPFSIVAFFVALYWDQFTALFGRGKEPARFDIRLREAHISSGTLAGVISAATAVDVLPHVEELWRCWRAERLAPN